MAIALLLVLSVSLIAGAKDFLLVSVHPFYTLVKDIAGHSCRVETLIPPQADYHLYEIRPRDIAKIGEAKIVFVSGVPLGGWEAKVEDLAGRKAVRLVGGGEEHGRDPHIWVSPARMLKVSEKIYGALRRAGSDEGLDRRYNLVRSRLRDLHERYEEGLKNCKHRSIPVDHPFMSYLARDYGLIQLPLSSAGGHGDVSVRGLKEFLNRAEKEGIDFILAQKGERSKILRVLKENYGFRVIYLDMKITSGDYFTVMDGILSTLKKVLRCT